MKRYTGFTLAETLIVIGIIGVVAALTLPNLNHSTGDKERVTKVKKIYSGLSDAYGRAEAIYGPVDGWFNNIDPNNEGDRSNIVGKRISEYLKVSKVCGSGAGCFSASYTEDLAPSYMVLLSDGTSVRFRVRADVECTAYNENDECTEETVTNAIDVIEVDVDGPNKGKDESGSDFFEFALLKDATSNTYSVVPDGRSIANGVEPEGEFNGMYATWIIQNDNAAYLKCSGLNWDTAKTCDQVVKSNDD